MVRITCDNCGAQKPEKLPPTVEWILGYNLKRKRPNPCSAPSDCSTTGMTGAFWNWEPFISARFNAGTST